MNLFVFSSSRALNNFYINHSQALLPEAKTIKTFFEEIIIIEDKIKIPKFIRSVILYQVIQDIDIEKIGFDKAFLRFLENSKFLFHFFDELEAAMLDINLIDTSDTYGDYEDHLRILHKIYNAYKLELEKHNLYDIGIEPTIYKEYLEYYDNIYIFVDGILSRKDWHILELASKHTNIEIIFQYTSFNAFIFDRILPYALELDYQYSLNIATKEIVSSQKILPTSPHIKLYSFATRLNQAMLVIAKVNEWLEAGFSNIAIILPSQDFVKYLKLFDTSRNLNYAMGVENTALIQKIKQLQIAPNPAISKLQNVFNAIESLSPHLLNDLWELKFFEDFFENLSNEEICDFIINNISNIDDTNGGKVRVIEILETRGMQFDKVIIVDFNEDFVPKLSDNDMFLNTTIRKRVGLPTLKDKESLQRHYYCNAINNAKEVHIAFSSKILPSSLIDDIGLNSQDAIDGESLWQFFAPTTQSAYLEEDFIYPYTDKNFSVSKLKTFITCPRKFYFAYCKQLKSCDDEQNNAYVGNLIHDYFMQCDDFSSQKLEAFLHQKASNPAELLDLEILKYKVEPFLKFQREILREREILHREFEFNIHIKDFCFHGRIDRIDRSGNQIFLIDYKVKNHFNINNEGFLQLYIYKKAIESLYQNYSINALYYDVLGDKHEHYMNPTNEEEAQDMVESCFKQFSQPNINFHKSEDMKVCQYCDYKYLCNRY